MKNIILTIDTEGPRGSDPVLYQIWGRANDGNYYGVPKIIEICDKYDIKAIFFVDIPEIWDLGYEKIKEVILYIKEKGHDVGVHVHPHHMPGESRHFLFDYSKEEQFDIIKKCTDKYIEICGETPKSFRAGKYGANRDTLDIIEELGYQYDFSEFYSNKWCGINPEIAYVLPQRYKSLLEIPVTIFKSCSLFGYSRFDKLEVTNITSEMKHVLKLYSKSKNDEVIVLFMHSFSFVDFMHHPDNPPVCEENIRRFESVLNFIYSSKLFCFISEKDLSNIEVPDHTDSKDNVLGTRGLFRQLYYTYLRAYEIKSYNTKAKILVGAFWFCGVIGFAILLFILKYIFDYAVL